MQPNTPTRNYALAYGFLLTLVTAIFSGYLFWHQVYATAGGAYVSDMRAYVDQIALIEQGKLQRPHMGLHYSVILIKALLHVDIEQGLVITLTVYAALQAALIFAWLHAALHRTYTPLFILLAALALMLVTPLYLPAFDSSILRGPGHPHAWHNQTMVASIPFAIVAFLGWYALLEQRKNIKFCASLALITAIDAFIKPNFALSLLPAVGLYVLVYKKHAPRQLVTLALTALPTLLLFLWQYTVLFVENPLDTVHQLLFDPMGVWSVHSPCPLVSILLGCAFPMAFLATCRHHLSRLSWLAWMNWLAATVFGALFAETPRYHDGNLMRGYYMAMLFIFITTTIDFMKAAQTIPAPPGKTAFTRLHLCWLLLITHAVIGFYYYGWILAGNHYY